MPRKLIRMITVGISVGVVLGTAVLVIQSRGARTSRTAITPETITVQQSVSYIAITDDQMIDSADFIFRGIVADISRTRWNQDSGEAWDDGVLLHEIRIDVLQPIVSTIDSPKQVCCRRPQSSFSGKSLIHLNGPPKLCWRCSPNRSSWKAAW